MLKHTQTLTKRIKNKGFTLVELIVAIGIMILLLSILLLNYNKFDTGVVLTNLSYDIGLSIRKAQTYGISVKGREFSGSQTYTYPYGIHFDVSDPTKLNQYTLFVDLDSMPNGKFGDGQYEPANGEKVETFTLPGGFRIDDLCISTPVTGVLDCSANKIDITFTRPNPDAYVMVTYGSSAAVHKDEAVYIQVTSIKDNNSHKMIVVRSTGQISVECDRNPSGKCI